MFFLAIHAGDPRKAMKLDDLAADPGLRSKQPALTDLVVKS